MTILVNRQSVCAADDVEDHEIELSIATGDSFADVMQRLIDMGYFPQIAGNDVVWTLTHNDSDIFSWHTKRNQIFPLKGGVLSLDNDQRYKVSYYSSPAIRAQDIFQQMDGFLFHIWHEGFMAEYRALTEDS